MTSTTPKSPYILCKMLSILLSISTYLKKNKTPIPFISMEWVIHSSVDTQNVYHPLFKKGVLYNPDQSVANLKYNTLSTNIVTAINYQMKTLSIQTNVIVTHWCWSIIDLILRRMWSTHKHKISYSSSHQMETVNYYQYMFTIPFQKYKDRIIQVNHHSNNTHKQVVQ